MLSFNAIWNMRNIANSPMFDRVKLPKSFLAVNVSDSHASDAAGAVDGSGDD